MAEEPPRLAQKGSAAPIPIRNLYYLFLYAWDRFPEGRALETGTDDSPDVLNLFARVLASGVRRLLRRGLDRGYRDVVDELLAPKGRILLAASLQRGSLIFNRVVCASDELTPDVPHNRIIKATLLALGRSEEVDNDLRWELRNLAKRLVDVAEQELTRDLFRKIQLSRNNGHYNLLMRVCELVLDNLQPEEHGKGSRFASILEDEERMSAIFESFLRNFYRSEQNEFSAESEGIAWQATYPDPSQQRFLPTMRTDITLRSRSRTIVADAKFYRQTLVRHMGGSEKVRSAHLYQLLAYLRNIKLVEPDIPAEGLLLYPRTTGEELRLEFSLSGHRVRVCTVDLNCSWRSIHEHLLALLH